MTLMSSRVHVDMDRNLYAVPIPIGVSHDTGQSCTEVEVSTLGDNWTRLVYSIRATGRIVPFSR